MDTATAGGQPLEDVKRVRVGTRETARNFNDLPIINIQFISGVENPTALQFINTDEIVLEVVLIDNRIDSNNTYYTLPSTGALFLFENMLNVLDKDTSGNVDICFAGTTFNHRTFSYTINESQKLIEIVLTITVQVKQFPLGSR